MSYLLFTFHSLSFQWLFFLQDNSPEAILARRKALPPQRKNKVKQSKYAIRVMKREGGTLRFARDVRVIQKKNGQGRIESQARSSAKERGQA